VPGKDAAAGAGRRTDGAGLVVRTSFPSIDYTPRSLTLVASHMEIRPDDPIIFVRTGKEGIVREIDGSLALVAFRGSRVGGVWVPLRSVAYRHDDTIPPPVEPPKPTPAG